MPESVLRLRVTPPLGEPFEHACEGDSLVVGRSSKADLVLSDRFLSRLHARFYREGRDWLVEDLGSRNTTLLNGNPVTAPARLSRGDRVRVSETVISIEGFGGAEGLTDIQTPSDSVVFRSASELTSGVETISMTRLKILNEVHRALATPISRTDLLDLILERAFAHLRPEEAVIFTRRPDGTLDPEARRRLPGVTGNFLYSRSLGTEVVDKKQAALVLDAQTDERFAAAQSILSSGIRSLVAAPLLDDAGALGMIVLSSRAHVRRFSEEDMEMLASLASVAAMRLRNLSLAEEAARRRELEKELAIARQIQVALLPEILPEVPGYSIFAANEPSRAVSGDLYEVQAREDGQIVLVIADVSGKGISASLLAASFDALLIGPIEVGHPPDALCARVSRRLFIRTPPERYVTAFVAQLEPATGAVAYTNAGHNTGLVVRAGGAVERLEASGVPLGLFPAMEYSCERTSLLPGDMLALYTDGITEAASPGGEEYGLERLEAFLRARIHEPLPAISLALEKDLETFAQGLQLADDRTLVLLRRNP